MKNTKYIIATLFGIFLLSFSACDIVEGPYLIDDNTIPIDSSTTFVKKVLIEDFTGHRCPNCPAAAVELVALQEFYGDNIIGIAVHPNSVFSKPNPITTTSYTYDFRTQFGDDIDNIFDITTIGLPRGMVNRIGFDTEHQLGKDEWAAVVQSELDKQPIFGIKLTSDVSEGNGTIEVDIESLTDLNENYNVVVCLTESGIIQWQKDNAAGDIENYEHNHVLRSILNSATGESIGNSFIDGDLWEKNYTVNISNLEDYNSDFSLNNLSMGNGNCKGWVENKMEVVVYIYNTSNYEIVQVEEIHLTNH